MSATPRQQLEGRVTRRFVRMGSPPVSAARMGRDAVEAYYNEDVEHEHHMLVSYEAIQIMLEVVPTFATGIRAAFETAKLQMERIDAIQRQFGLYARMMYNAKAEQPEQFDASGLPKVDGPHPHGAAVAVPPSTCDCNTRSVDLDGELQHYDTCASLAERSGTFTPYPRQEGDGPTPNLMFVPDDRITGYPHHYILNGDHSACTCGGHATSCETWNTNWRHAHTLCAITRTNCGHSPRHTYGQVCPGDETGCTAHGGPDCICDPV